MCPWAGHGGGGGDVGFVICGEEEVGAIVAADYTGVMYEAVYVAGYGFGFGE